MSLTITEDPKSSTVPEEAQSDDDNVLKTLSGRTSRPPERLGFDVPRHMLAGARSDPPPRSPCSYPYHVTEQAGEEQGLNDTDQWMI